MVYARIINLDSRTDRWSRVKGMGIERFSAIKSDTIEALSHHARCVFSNRTSHHALSGLGAVGCALSHIQVWRDFLASDETHCAIFEDDIAVVDAHAYIANAQAKKSDIVLMGWLGHLHRIWGNFDGRSVIPWPASCGFMGAHAYLISRHAATMLLKHALPLEMQVDYYVQSVAWREGLRISLVDLPKIRQVWTGGSNVFTLCFQCEPTYPALVGVLVTLLLVYLSSRLYK